MLLPMLDTISERLNDSQSNREALLKTLKKLTKTIAVAFKVKSPYVEFSPKDVKEE